MHIIISSAVCERYTAFFWGFHKLMTKTSLNGPIFLLGSHKSGSSLLRSLLDGHTDLFVIPSETHFFQYTGYWVDYKLRRSYAKRLGKKDQIESLTNYIKEENSNNDPYGAVKINGKYDIDSFFSYLGQNKTFDMRSLFQTYMEALHFCLVSKKLPEEKLIVEKSVENAEFAFVLRHLFPRCRFIHIIRNPYATLVAIRKAKSEKGYPFMRDAILSIYNSYYNLFKNLTVLDDYLVIRYEELVASTKRTMQRVANFLNINFQDKILEPTVFGEPWNGNSTSNNKFSGVSSKPLENWKESIEDLEIILVNKVLRPVFDKYNYERLSPRHHPIKQKFYPIRGENITTYIKNRTLLWYL